MVRTGNSVVQIIGHSIVSVGLGITAERTAEVLKTLGCALRKSPSHLKLGVATEWFGYSPSETHSLTVHALQDLGLTLLFIAVFGTIALMLDLAVEHLVKGGRLQRVIVVASILISGAMFDAHQNGIPQDYFDNSKKA
jgi:hypothetical protein